MPCRVINTVKLAICTVGNVTPRETKRYNSREIELDSRSNFGVNLRKRFDSEDDEAKKTNGSRIWRHAFFVLCDHTVLISLFTRPRNEPIQGGRVVEEFRAAPRPVAIRIWCAHNLSDPCHCGPSQKHWTSRVIQFSVVIHPEKKAGYCDPLR